MENLRRTVRQLIREIYENYMVDEAKLTLHMAKDRRFERFNLKGSVPVAYYKGDGDYEYVGTAVFPQNMIDQFNNRVDVIEKVNFPKSKSYGVSLAYCPINPQSVKYFSEVFKEEAKGKKLFYHETKTNSFGDSIWGIIRDNNFVTAMFVMSVDRRGKEADLFNKLDVDVIIKNFKVVEDGKIR